MLYWVKDGVWAGERGKGKMEGEFGQPADVYGIILHRQLIM